MHSIIRGYKGPEIQNFDHSYLKKNKYFEKQHRIKDAQNDALNNMQPLTFCNVAPIWR